MSGGGGEPARGEEATDGEAWFSTVNGEVIHWAQAGAPVLREVRGRRPEGLHS